MSKHTNEKIIGLIRIKLKGKYIFENVINQWN